MTDTTLTDRYVWAATRSVPDGQRADLERELRERIGDATDALVQTGRTTADAERMALVELGDPAALAASYVDRPLQLIGPRYFLTWWRLEKLLYSVALPLTVAAVLFAKLISGADLGAAIGDAVVVGFSLAVHLGFWPTLAFAVLERTPGRSADLQWTPDLLPQLPEVGRPGRRGELIGSLVFLGIFAVAIVWQQFGVIFIGGERQAIPLLNPDLWSFWIPYFLVLIVLEMLFAVAIYAWGWNWWLAVANLVLNVAFVVPALWLFTTGQLVNPEALDVMGWPWGDAGRVIVPILVFTVIGVAAWDVIDGVIKTVRGRGSAMPTLGRI